LRAQKQAAERDAFIARVRKEAAAIGLIPEQLFSPAPPAPRKAASPGTRKRGAGVVPAKYRSPDGTNSWSGRGKSPAWVSEYEATGKSREDLLIRESQPDLIEQAKREHGES
jgi:DNA-binding protein H-NS